MLTYSKAVIKNAPLFVEAEDLYLWIAFEAWIEEEIPHDHISDMEQAFKIWMGGAIWGRNQ